MFVDGLLEHFHSLGIFMLLLSLFLAGLPILDYAVDPFDDGLCQLIVAFLYVFVVAG
jgi:hypothetical protein